ncbi:MAG: hypothetical protein LKE43_01200 [Olsenella sp.]|nr:hypothetical protein [Olsenella sp.]
MSLSTTRITSGDSVTVTPATSGDLWGATYNYVWQRDGSWAEGDWGSSELFEGHRAPRRALPPPLGIRRRLRIGHAQRLVERQQHLV